MSLGSSMNASVAGLKAQSQKMSAISDNIANSQTVGYKRADVQFSSLVVGSGGSGNFAAGGVTASKRQEISHQAIIQGTSVETDMAIDGDGFFIVRDGINSDSEFAYTRAGSFRPDANGNYINANGYYLQGWLLDDNGQFNNSGSLSSVQIVGLDAIQGLAEPSTTIDFRANLSAAQAPVAAYAVGDMASGTVTPHFARMVEVYDSQGMIHNVTYGFTKTGANEWAVEAYVTPASDVTDANGLIMSGTAVFTGEGKLDEAASSASLFDTFTPNWTTGATAKPIQLSFGDLNSNGLTQFGESYSVVANRANGGVRGQVASLEVSKTGVVSAIFEDGTIRPVFQLPIATFVNPDGLSLKSGNAFMASQNSGAPTINVAGSGGSGSVASSSLEGSATDLAQEMADMIVTQRAYSGNATVVRTVDDMLQETTNLKR